MSKNKNIFSLKMMHRILAVFLVISVIVFISIGLTVHYQDRKETYVMAEKTTAYLKTECQKYDNYMRGNSARSMQDLLDAANGLNKYISASRLSDPEFLEDYIHTEHVGGVIVFDRSFSVIAQADLDNKDSYELWEETLEGSEIREILQYPQKSYIDHVTVGGIPYDIAAVASEGGTRLIFCYSSTQKPTTDPYELSLRSILENNSFYKNPTLAITDGTTVLSTNNPIVEELGTTQYQELASSIDWKEDQFTKFKYQNVIYYGLRRVYNGYYVYSVYDSRDVFNDRNNVIVLAFTVYMAMGIIILLIQKHFDKISISRMEKQLGIIQGIGASYSSVFLLHTDKKELEAVKPSERLAAIYQKHPGAYDFLFAVCKDEVAKDDYSTVMHFLDLDTLADRLKSKKYLCNEVRDVHGTWYSISLIPQKCDEEGNVQSVLVTTKDVTSAKQVEELSFKDKLTGLHNRNYMESRSRNFVRAGDFPVSLIMADCNYLKRTNDTLGHEYGDLLLQRVANAITDSIPDTCIAMRVGGDEFLILCTQCTGEKANRIIEEIRKKLKERSDDKLTLSVAFGVSTTESGTFSFEEAYEAADQEMYRDKKASREER